VLEGAYDEEMSVEEARDAAARAVNSAIERDTASGNGMLLSVVTAEGVETEQYEHPTEAL
jgi:proteasome beta subunit